MEELAMKKRPAELLEDLSVSCQLRVASEDFAKFMDERDEIAEIRKRFHVPKKSAFEESANCPEPEEEVIYLCGNSLGLQPKQTETAVVEQIRKWAKIGVEVHFQDPLPAAACDDYGRESLGALLGTDANSVVLMNGLTVNLHLLLISFYQPTKDRYKILIEQGAFPSDRYAVRSQALMRGYPEDAVIEIGPRKKEHTIRTEDILELIRTEGESIAVICLSGVQYYTGQTFDMGSITKAGRAQGCFVGWDLAHAIGNVKIELDQWGADFACWCTYKYLNSGAGCIAGAYVNTRHARRNTANLLGWWSNRAESRFAMQDRCEVADGVSRFKLCNPSPLLVSCVLASLKIFDEVGMEKILRKQFLLTGFLEYLLDRMNEDLPRPFFHVITPRDSTHRGSQLSVVFALDLHDVHAHLKRHGVICDIRLPNVMRLAPAPLYNSFSDVFRFVSILRSIILSILAAKSTTTRHPVEMECSEANDLDVSFTSK